MDDQIRNLEQQMTRAQTFMKETQTTIQEIKAKMDEHRKLGDQRFEQL